MPEAGHQHRRLITIRSACTLAVVLLLTVAAGCGARLTPEQRNAVVGDGAGAAGGRGSVEGVETGGGR